jgi:hypothetical protein
MRLRFICPRLYFFLDNEKKSGFLLSRSYNPIITKFSRTHNMIGRKK